MDEFCLHAHCGVGFSVCLASKWGNASYIDHAGLWWLDGVGGTDVQWLLPTQYSRRLATEHLEWIPLLIGIERKGRVRKRERKIRVTK